MAQESSKPKRKLRKAQSVRQKAESSQVPSAKPSRLRGALKKVALPIRVAHRTGKKEYYLPMPGNRVGKFLNKRRHIIPSYFRNAFKELRDVKWPNRKQTTQLTLAVFIFATIFGVIIAVTDYGLDKLFKKILLN